MKSCIRIWGSQELDGQDPKHLSRSFFLALNLSEIAKLCNNNNKPVGDLARSATSQGDSSTAAIDSAHR